MLGETTVGTNATGRAPFSFTYTPVVGLPVLSTTVTDPSGNTSMFSVRPIAPTNFLSVSQTIDQNTTLTFSNATSNAARIQYTDSGTNPVKFTLSVTHGILNLKATSGLVGSSNGSASLTYTGSLTSINAALDGLVYTPNTGYNGSETLNLISDNQAGPELGGNLTTTSTSSITIRALADSPTVTVASTFANAQTTSGLSITPGAATPGVAFFKITAVSSGVVYLNDGSTVVPDGSFILASCVR